MPSESCRLCGHNDLIPLFTAKGYPLVRCKQCQFVQVARRPTDAELAEIYQPTYFTHSKYQDDSTLLRENRRRLQLVKMFVSVGAPVIELGCGIGDFICHAQRDYVMSGSDLSEYAINLARQRNPDAAERLWAASLETPENPLLHHLFDAVCCWDVIEHLWNLHDVTRQIVHYVRPGGYIFLSTPNIGAPVPRLLGKTWAFMTPPEHLSFFNRQSLTYLFTQIQPGQRVYWRTSGKWANLGFIAYKLHRVMPSTLTRWLMHILEGYKLAVYVPTQDVQYAVFRLE